jgi:hypothetical protein
MIDGWAYFTDKPKKFNITVQSKGFDLSSYREFFDRYNIDTENMALNVNLNAEGDTERRVNLKSDIQIKSEGLNFLKKDVKDISVDADASYDIRDGLVTIDNIALNVGDISAVRLKGVVKDISEKPLYSANIRIDKLDLSLFHFMKDLKIRGIMTSDNLTIKGKFDLAIPEIAGSVALNDAAVKAAIIDFDEINADLEFSSEQEMSVIAEGSAKILHAGKYMVNSPADIRFSINTRGKPEKMNLTSSFSISPVDFSISKDRNAYLERINIDMDGTLKATEYSMSYTSLSRRNLTFSLNGSVMTEGFRYADYNIKSLNSYLGVDYRGDVITINDLKIDSEGLKSSASQIRIRIPEKKDRSIIVIKDLNAEDTEKKAEIEQLDITLNLNAEDNPYSGDFAFSAKKILSRGFVSSDISGSGNFDKKEFSVVIPNADFASGSVRLTASGKTSGGPFPLNINLRAEKINLRPVSKAASAFIKIPFSISGDMKKAAFHGTLDSADSLNGYGSVEAEKISVLKTDIQKDILKNGSVNTEINFKGQDLEFKADADVGDISTKISGFVKGFLKKDRSLKVNAILPEVQVTAIRDSLWDVFPDRLLYAGLNGRIYSDLSINYSKSGLKVRGDISLKDFILEGEFGEYSLGPVNGVVPVLYSKNIEKQKGIAIPVFDRSEFETLEKYYSLEPVANGYNRITIGSFSYGFRLIEDIDVWFNQNGSVLNIGRFSGNMFGGRLYGSAVFDISEGFHYRVGILLKGLSLIKLCEGVEPIKGYISGKVDGIAHLKGSGTGISGLIGKADFWTYSSGSEKTKISRKFLQRLGGPSLKTYLGDRSYNKGKMGIYLKDGFIVFRELEISNRSFIGLTDLAVKVAPFSNRIALDHLMWTMTEAAQRAHKKQL